MARGQHEIGADEGSRLFGNGLAQIRAERRDSSQRADAERNGQRAGPQLRPAPARLAPSHLPDPRVEPHRQPLHAVELSERKGQGKV